MAPALTLTADVLSPLEYSKMFSEFIPQIQSLKWDPQNTGEPVQSSRKEPGSESSGRAGKASILYQPPQPGP